jgi:hypothetical protein
VATSVPSAQPADRNVVVVIGPGRSGTSTLAGALAHSGYAVPGSAIPGDRTNPGGFFEPSWVVDLHRSLLHRAGVSTLDTSPDAYRFARHVGEARGVRRGASDWLAARLEEHPRLVVKDPRIVWFHDLWVETCAALDARVTFATMVRHPAEVSSSRRRYYTTMASQASRTQNVHAVAGWVNVSLLAEEATSGAPRAFVRYVDLVADWRPALATVAGRLDLLLEPPPQDVPHPVDDFIDPALHRLRVDWDDVDVPTALRDLAEAVWQALSELADRDDLARRDQLTSLRAEYAAMIRDAAVLTRDGTRRRIRTARRRARRAVTDQRATEADPGRPPRPPVMSRAASEGKHMVDRARERRTRR